MFCLKHKLCSLICLQIIEHLSVEMYTVTLTEICPVCDSFNRWGGGGTDRIGPVYEICLDSHCVACRNQWVTVIRMIWPTWIPHLREKVDSRYTLGPFCNVFQMPSCHFRLSYNVCKAVIRLNMFCPGGFLIGCGGEAGRCHNFHLGQSEDALY